MTLSFHRKGNNVEKTEPKPEKQSNTTASGNQDSYLNGIGSYEFIKSLGSGKFSKVMLAYHLETHQQVAIKVRARIIIKKKNLIYYFIMLKEEEKLY